MGPIAEKTDAVSDHSTIVPVATNTDPYSQIAPLWHTALVLMAQGVLAYRGRMRLAGQSALSVGRIRIYEQTIFFEWLMFGVVLIGVWLYGSSSQTVLGQRWTSMGRFLRDLGIGVLFLIVAIVMGSILPHGTESGVRLILPQTRSEMWLWIALSITAGICEEALYRGYLQRQFIATTRSATAGIILSAAAFGGAHAYQGWQSALQIGLLGGIAGTIAYRWRSVRPGMIEHVLQDLLGGFVRH